MTNASRDELAAPSAGETRVFALADNGGGVRNVAATASLSDEFDRDVWNLFGLPVDAVNLAAAASQVEAAARAGRRLRIVTPNVNFLCMARDDAVVRRDVIDNEISLVDGAPLLLLARLAGAPFPERVAGSDLFDVLRRRPAPRGRKLRVFFFGGLDGAGARACAALNADVGGGMECVGSLDPGVGGADEMSGDSLINAINAARPDFVVAALGARKGLAWIASAAARLDAPVISHLGAVVNFVGGDVRRAPRFLQRLGLEWAWRILQEPALWRRYWSDAKTLADIMIRQALPLALNPATPTGAAPVAVVSSAGGELEIAVAGDQLAGKLEALRRALRQAVSVSAPVTVDLSRIGAFDGAFLGQLLMLEKALMPQNRRFTMRGLDRAARRRLKWHGFAFAEGRAAPRGEAVDGTESDIAGGRQTA